MKSLIALVSGSGWHVGDLHRAAVQLDLTLHAVPFPDISASVGMDRGGPAIRAGGRDLLSSDGVLVRMMPPGSLEQVVFRMDAIHRVAAAGVPVLNSPRAVEAAVDKYLTLTLLATAGLPVPTTWAGQSATEALTAFDELGGDVVVKPIFGSEGRGLVRVSDRELAWRTFHAIERLGAVLYLQRFIRHPGHDYRIFVLRGSVLGSMRRHATPGEWRTNVSLGGRAERCPIDAEAERLAIDSARALGADMAGVDLIPDLDRGRLTILEVNAVPGWRALSRVTGIDIASAVLAALCDSRG
jgi:tetrahydromethanopterin:alpha-L-glutamate ligase